MWMAHACPPPKTKQRSHRQRFAALLCMSEGTTRTSWLLKALTDLLLDKPTCTQTRQWPTNSRERINGESSNRQCMGQLSTTICIVRLAEMNQRSNMMGSRVEPSTLARKGMSSITMHNETALHTGRQMVNTWSTTNVTLGWRLDDTCSMIGTENST